MDIRDFDLEPDERVFRTRGPAASGAAPRMIGGAALLGLSVVGFVIALYSRVDQFTLHFMTTMPALLGIGAIVAARTTARTPHEVGVGPGGVRVASDRGAQTFGWDQIAWSTVATAPLTNRRLLTLYDTGGRALVVLSDALDDFDALIEAVVTRIAAKGDPTTDRIQAAKAKRSAVFMALGGVAFLALAVSVASMTRSDLRAARLLKEAAVPGQARIERRFLAPNGVTPRLEYRITTPEGRSATRNAEVVRPVWDALEGAQTVPVLYVPGEPSISRLAIGEAEDRDAFKNPVIGYGLPAIVALMSILFLVASALMWRGLDIDLDSKTGRLSIKKFGTGR